MLYFAFHAAASFCVVSNLSFKFCTTISSCSCIILRKKGSEGGGVKMDEFKTIYSFRAKVLTTKHVQ